MNFRDLSEVFSELSAKWEELSDVEKSEIGYLASATRQRAIFENLMRNIADGTAENSRVQQLYNEALNGEGATLEANAKYVDSYTGKMNTMKGIWQEFASSLVESESIKGLMDMMISLLEVLDSISPVIQFLVSASIPLLVGAFVNVTLSAVNTEQKFSSLILKLTGFDIQAKKTTATNIKLAQSFKTVGDRASLASKLTSASSAGLKVYSSTVKTSAVATNGFTTAVSSLQKAVSALSLAFSVWMAVAPYVTKWVDSFVNSAKYAREGVQEFTNAISEIVDKTARLNNAADSMERFEELWNKYKSSMALGVDDFLQTDEMAEFESLLANLTDVIPELKTLWEDKNKITAQGIKLVNEELQRQIELQNILAKEEIAKSRKDVEKTEKNLDNDILSLSRYQQEKNMYDTEMANIKEKIVALNKELEEADNGFLKSHINSEIKRQENRLAEIEGIKKNLESEILEKQKALAEYDSIAYKNNNLMASMEAQGLDTTGMSEMKLVNEEALALSEQKVANTIARISAIKEEARTAEQQAEYEDALRRQQGFEEKIRLEEQLASKQEEIRTLQESIAENSTEEKRAKLNELLEETEVLGSMLTNLEERLNTTAISMDGGTVAEFNISTVASEEEIYDLVGIIRDAQDIINNTPLEMEVVVANEEKLYDEVWEIQDSLLEIINAQAELADLGYLSDNTLKGLSEKYSEIMHYIGNSAEMQQFLNSLLDEEVAKKDLIAEQLNQNNYNRLMLDEGYYQTKIATDQAYVNFHAQVQDVLANSELAKDQQTLNVFKTGNDAKIGMLQALIEVIKQTDWAVAESVNNALAAMSLISQIRDNWTPEAFQVSIPKVTLPSMPKPTYKPASTSTKKPSTSTKKEKEVEDLKLKINLFYKWEKAIQDVEHRMSKLDKVIKAGTGQQKVAAIKEQIELYKELAKIQEDLLKAQREEEKRLRTQISNHGFRVEKDGTVVNYTQRLQELEKWANSATGDEKEARKKKVQEIKELLDDYVNMVKDINSTELEVDSLNGNLQDKKEELEDYYNELLDVVSDTESEITSMIKKELDKRKEALVKNLEDQKKLLQKAKDAFTKENKEEDYRNEHNEKKQEIAELQQALAIAMKDQSLAGKKAIAQLQEQLETAKKELADMERDKAREDQENWFDEEMERLEEEQEKLEEEWDKKYNDEYIANMVRDLLSAGITSVEGEVVSLSSLVSEHLEGSFSLLGDKLQSEFLDKLEQAKEIASNLSEIFKELNVNLNPRDSLTSATSYSMQSAVASASAMMSSGIYSYLREGVKATPYENNNSMSIGSLLSINGNVDRTVLPNLEDIVNKAVDKLQANMRKQLRLGTGRI